MGPSHLTFFVILTGALTLNTQAVLIGLTGNDGLGAHGGTQTYAAESLSVTVAAWSYGPSATAFQAARLGEWNTGLGVSNAEETTGSPYHQVDNAGVNDFVLFLFNQVVDITTVRIDPYGTYDRDVSYWVGTVAPGLSLAGKTYANLSGPLGLGFQLGPGLYGQVDVNGTRSGSALDINLANLRMGNAILFGARVGNPATSIEEDYFKITSLGVTPAPEPTTALFGLAVVGFCTAARRRSRAAA